jgi:hypothetical protein
MSTPAVIVIHENKDAYQVLYFLEIFSRIDKIISLKEAI